MSRKELATETEEWHDERRTIGFTGEHLFDVDEFRPNTTVELFIHLEKILLTFDDRGTR